MAVTLASVDGTWTNLTPSYDAGELRRADAAMFASGGVATGLVVTVDGADVVTVTPGSVVISGEDAVTGTGVYRAGTQVPATGALEARNATNPRIDLVVFRQYDTDVVGAHPRKKSEIEIVTGTPSATPGVPVKPSMAVELARVTVPASGGGAATVNSSSRVYAQAVGGADLPARIRVGTTLVNTDASGNATVAHGGPSTPTAVFAKVTGTATYVAWAASYTASYVAWAASYTASSFTVTLKVGTTGAAWDTTTWIEWIAVWA